VWPRASRKFATVAHEMRFDRQTLRKKCDFDQPCATLKHEMRFDCHKKDDVKLRFTSTLRPQHVPHA
jgi:hypothetical protein